MGFAITGDVRRLGERAHAGLEPFHGFRARTFTSLAIPKRSATELEEITVNSSLHIAHMIHLVTIA